MSQLKLSFLLIVFMSMIGTKGFAYDIAVANADGKTIFYDFINNGTALSVCAGVYSGNIVIPASITYDGNTYSVMTIGYGAFIGSSPTSVSIPNSVTSIGEYAFEYCSGLTSVTIGNSVTSIGYQAFYGCSSLTSVTIPSSVTSIELGAFVECIGLASIKVNSGNTVYDSRDNCNAIIKTGTNELILGCKNTIIPNSVTSIGGSAFSGCSSLTSVTIPNSVTSIGGCAFYDCSGLTSVTIPNSVTSIGSMAFCGCSGLTSVTIGNSVTSIGYDAFFGCSGLTSIEVNSGNTVYGSPYNCNAIIKTETNELFLGCKNTIIPNSVTSIGEWAFYDCSGLTSVTIPGSVTNIGERAFAGCNGLTSVTIPSSVTSIGYCAFYGCSGLTSVTIQNGVTSIGERAFQGCRDLTSVTIPNSVTSIGGSAFYGCSGLTSVTVKREIPVSIDYNTFSNRSNATLYVPAGSKSTYEAAEYWQDFKEIVVKIPVTRILLNYPSLTLTSAGQTYTLTATLTPSNATNKTVTWTSSNAAVATVSNTGVVTAVANGTAVITATTNDGTNLTAQCNVTVNISPVITFADANVKDICVDNWDTNGDGELSEAEAAAVTNLGTVFKGNTSIASFDELQYFTGLSSIGNYAFENCSSLTSVTIGNSVTSIGGGAFSGCSGLTSVHISDIAAWCKISFTSNYSNPLYYAHHLYLGEEEITDLVIPNSVTSIGVSVFSGCSGLTSVTIPNSVTSIGDGAFYSCSGLTSVTIPNSVTSIGQYAFHHCSGLTSVTIPNSVTSIEDGAFFGCSLLTSVTIPNSVTSIERRTFAWCSGLTSVAIPGSVTSIGWCAFGFCSLLTSVTIPNSVTSIEDMAFYGCSSLTSVIVESSTPVTITSDVFSNHANAKLYVPSGCKATYTAANYWEEFKAIKEYPDCDVNQDGDIDVVDVVDIARYVVDIPAETFDVFLADLNSDKTVNVADAVVLVNEIAGDTNWSRRMRAPQSEHNDVLKLTENDDNSLSWHIEGNGRYTAFQFDLYLPEDVDVTQMRLNNQRKQKHQLLYNKVREGQWRVVALSTSNRVFEGVAGELLNIELDGFATDDVLIDNIHFVTAQGTDVMFDAVSLSRDGMTTKVNTLPVDAENSQSVYSLSGQRRNAPQKGLNIIGGKKVIIK